MQARSDLVPLIVTYPDEYDVVYNARELCSLRRPCILRGGQSMHSMQSIRQFCIFFPLPSRHKCRGPVTCIAVQAWEGPAWHRPNGASPAPQCQRHPSCSSATPPRRPAVKVCTFLTMPAEHGTNLAQQAEHIQRVREAFLAQVGAARLSCSCALHFAPRPCARLSLLATLAGISSAGQGSCALSRAMSCWLSLLPPCLLPPQQEALAVVVGLLAEPLSRHPRMREEDAVMVQLVITFLR